MSAHASTPVLAGLLPHACAVRWSFTQGAALVTFTNEGARALTDQPKACVSDLVRRCPAFSAKQSHKLDTGGYEVPVTALYQWLQSRPAAGLSVAGLAVLHALKAASEHQHGVPLRSSPDDVVEVAAWLGPSPQATARPASASARCAYLALCAAQVPMPEPLIRQPPAQPTRVPVPAPALAADQLRQRAELLLRDRARFLRGVTQLPSADTLYDALRRAVCQSPEPPSPESLLPALALALCPHGCVGADAVLHFDAAEDSDQALALLCKHLRDVALPVLGLQHAIRAADVQLWSACRAVAVSLFAASGHTKYAPATLQSLVFRLRLAPLDRRDFDAALFGSKNGAHMHNQGADATVNEEPVRAMSRMTAGTSDKQLSAASSRFVLVGDSCKSSARRVLGLRRRDRRQRKQRSTRRDVLALRAVLRPFLVPQLDRELVDLAGKTLASAAPSLMPVGRARADSLLSLLLAGKACTMGKGSAAKVEVRGQAPQLPKAKRKKAATSTKPAKPAKPATSTTSSTSAKSAKPTDLTRVVQRQQRKKALAQQRQRQPRAAGAAAAAAAAADPEDGADNVSDSVADEKMGRSDSGAEDTDGDALLCDAAPLRRRVAEAIADSDVGESSSEDGFCSLDLPEDDEDEEDEDGDYSDGSVCSNSDSGGGGGGGAGVARAAAVLPASPPLRQLPLRERPLSKRAREAAEDNPSEVSEAEPERRAAPRPRRKK
jgi:hypothetical protein